MKKLLSGIAAAFIFGSAALGAGTTSTATYSGDNMPVEYDGSDYIECMYPNGNPPNFQSSGIRPELSVEQKIVKYDEDVPGSVQKVEFRLSGADGKYVSTSIHILFDNRLVIANPYKPLEPGDALSDEDIEFKSQLNYLYESENGKGEMWACTAGEDDIGKDGVLYTAEFILPYDAKVGDVYPIGFEFQSDDYTNDMFTNASNNFVGRLMQGYLFTQGMKNGYIKIESPDYQPPTEDTQPKIIPDSVKMTVGNTSQLLLLNIPQDEEVYWTSDNLGVVTVENGLVTAVGTGKATVYAICGNSLMSCGITVSPPNSVRGDANCDTSVNMSDVVMVMQANLNPKKYGSDGTSADHITAQGEANGDVDGKSGLAMSDALLIQQYTLSIISVL